MTNKFEGDVPSGEQFDDESKDKKSVEPEQTLSVGDIKKRISMYFMLSSG